MDRSFDRTVELSRRQLEDLIRQGFSRLKELESQDAAASTQDRTTGAEALRVPPNDDGKFGVDTSDEHSQLAQAEDMTSSSEQSQTPPDRTTLVQQHHPQAPHTARHTGLRRGSQPGTEDPRRISSNPQEQHRTQQRGAGALLRNYIPARPLISRRKHDAARREKCEETQKKDIQGRERAMRRTWPGTFMDNGQRPPQ